MASPLRIGIAGLGTVGVGALTILFEQAELLAQRCGRALEVAAVSAQNRSKDRGVDVSKLRWVENPLALAQDADIDVVVELIGGSEGVARQLVETALRNKKSVVTANKALLAHHGLQLAKLAEDAGVVLAFEAAVAGGIPIIKALRDGLAANRFERVAGIMNGTCNYILTQMQEQQCGFETVLTEAQKLGYAEAEPSFDVDGIDTAHKIALLASLAYGTAPAIKDVYVEGIRQVSLSDIAFAAELGYAVKLLGIAARSEQGLLQRVHPCLVPLASPVASVRGVYNAVFIEGDAVGRVFFEGRGAGAGPTGSSVVADIMDIARGVAYKPFSLSAAALKNLPPISMSALNCGYYLRLTVADKPGVLAEVTGIFKTEGISLRSLLQPSPKGGAAAQLVLTTHECHEAAMIRAMAAISALETIKEKPYMIRIENL